MERQAVLSASQARAPGLTPGLETCLVPLGLGPSFLLSILLFPPRAWRSARKPEQSGWSLLTADRHFYSLSPDYVSKCHLFLHFPVPAPPSLRLVAHLPVPTLSAWVTACHLLPCSSAHPCQCPVCQPRLRCSSCPILGGRSGPFQLAVNQAVPKNTLNYGKRHLRP